MRKVLKSNEMNLAEFQKKLDETPKIVRAWYAVRRWFLNIPSIPRQIKWFLQRVARGYSDDDLWYLDYVLGKHIIKCLKAFKKMNNCGIPSAFCYDEDGKRDRSDKEATKLWKGALKDMIDGFDHLINTDERNEDIWQKHEKGKLTDKEWFKAMQDRHAEATKKAKLFIEYFNCLWD